MFKMSFKELVVASTNGSVVCNDIVKLICLLLLHKADFNYVLLCSTWLEKIWKGKVYFQTGLKENSFNPLFGD